MAKAGRWEPKGGRTPSKDIVVDQVRDLVDRRLAMKRFEGRRRFVIVDPADAMNAQAQNALLKTLEEPPEETTLVLVAVEPGRAPADHPLALRARRVRAAARRRRLAGSRRAATRPRSPGRGRRASSRRARRRRDDGRELRSARSRPLARAARRLLRPRGLDAATPGDAGRGSRSRPPRRRARARARSCCELLVVWLRDVLAVAGGGGARALALAELAAATRRAGGGALARARRSRRRERAARGAAARCGRTPAPALALERMLIGWFHG